MADADLLLDPDEEDRPIGFGVGEDSLIPPTAEGLDDLDVGRVSQQVGDVGDAAAARVGDLPPSTLADQGVDAVSGGEAPAVAPPAPALAPVTERTVQQGGTQVAGVTQPVGPTAEAVSGRQSEVDKAVAAITAQTAQAQAEAAKQAQQEQAAEQADYLKRRQEAQAALDAKTKAFEGMKLEGPGERRHSFKSVLSVIFGGLGAAFRSAGGGSSENTALTQLQQKWQNETDIQKANIAAARDQVIQARTRLADVDEGRNLMRRDADARLLSKYNLALKQGEAQLRNQGVTQAGIDADRRIIQLREAKLLAEQKARAAEDDHALKQAKAAQLARAGGTPDDLRQAQIRVMNARAGLLERKGKGGGGGAGNARDQAVAKYLIDNPGDIPGAMQVAGPGFDSKRFDKIVTQTKGTEGQNKNAHQAKIGLDAINAIEASGYTPNKDDIQRWLNNSRLVNLANREGIVGGGAALAQTLGVIPQSEVEGLSPEAAAYFGNVRRYMETIGRAQSGAAISPSEWTNFFNQYGPNSSGGLDAARKYLQDQFKISGVAGRSLGAGTPQPAKTGGFPPKGQTRKLSDGRTVKFTDDEGGYVVVSSGRR